MAEEPRVTTNAATEKLKASLPQNPAPQGGAAVAEPPAKVEEPKVEAPKNETTAPVVEPKKEEIYTVAAESDLQKFLKENNLSSLDELKEKITPKRQKSEDEEELDVVKYGVESGEIKMDDYLSAKELQKKKDADVVFDTFAEKLLSKNKNITPAQIQDKFNKKYGDAIQTEELDESGNFKTKVIYDDEDISAEAKRIRDERIAPINTVKGKYKNFVNEQNFRNQVVKEFDTIAKTIPDKIPIRIDDKNSFDYDLDPKYKEQLLPKLAEQYALFRKNAPNEKLDPQAFMNFVGGVVMQDNFGNIANIFAGKKVAEKELEYSKKLENPIVDPLNLNTGSKPEVDMKAEAKKLGKELKNLK